LRCNLPKTVLETKGVTGKDAAKGSGRAVKASKPATPPRASASALWLPFTGALLLGAFPFLFNRVGDNPILARTFWAVSGVLIVFLLVLRHNVVSASRALHHEFVPKSVHYVQAVMHSCVYAYWGYYWREVYHYLPLIIAQIIFAYSFDMMLSWSRRDSWILGFGPIPIVLSTNLFLWFRDDWFYLQFLLIAVGFLAKEFVKWRREGRLTHIFNPSSLPLFIFSVVLIATKSTDMTLGIDISGTLHRPPYIYFEIFCLGLIVQSLFRVTLVTLFSVAALCGMNLLYTQATGDYNFIDSNIPVSVFLGCHLLITDPATSPRRNIGKIVFGFLYGLGVFGMYRFLAAIHAPEFYDKLLCVPALNLAVPLLDRFGASAESGLRRLSNSAPVRAIWDWSPQRSNLAWMSVWILFFAGMVSTGFLAKGKDHPGGDPEYWHRACEAGRGDACEKWTRALNVACDGNVASACLQVADVLDIGKLVPHNPEVAGVLFGRACDLGSSEACTRLLQFVQNGGKETFEKACQRSDGASCFILGSLYSGGAGLQQNPSAAFDLFRQSCDLGWWRGCGRLGLSYLLGQGTPADPVKALENFEKGCIGRNGASCVEAGKMYVQGSGIARNLPLARTRFQHACELGVQTACDWSKSVALQ
jgi:hypothetical protein